MWCWGVSEGSGNDPHEGHGLAWCEGMLVSENRGIDFALELETMLMQQHEACKLRHWWGAHWQGHVVNNVHCLHDDDVADVTGDIVVMWPMWVVSEDASLLCLRGSKHVLRSSVISIWWRRQVADCGGALTKSDDWQSCQWRLYHDLCDNVCSLAKKTRSVMHGNACLSIHVQEKLSVYGRWILFTQATDFHMHKLIACLNSRGTDFILLWLAYRQIACLKFWMATACVNDSS